MATLIIIYLLYLLVFMIFSAILIYHLWHFGFSGDKTRLAIIIYTLIASAIIISTFVILFIRSVVL